MDIKQEILTFIQRKEETGALLITGKWGSGKTHYLKNLADELNKEKKEYLCIISLFGIDSVQSLVKAVKECYLEANSTIFTKTARKIGKVVGKTVDSGLKVAESATGGNVAVAAVQKGFSSILSLGLLDFISVKNYIGRGKSQRQFVLVFDDLERCKINIIDLLGIINEYCENRNIKTIILASEEKLLLEDNSSKKIELTENGTNKEILITEKQKTQNDYADFKEKVIFQTLNFEVDYSEIIDSMIASYTQTASDYAKFLQDNAEVIKQVFIESGCNNLRLIKAILVNFERVYNICCKQKISKHSTVKIFYGYAVKYFDFVSSKKSDKQDFNAKIVNAVKVTAAKRTNPDAFRYSGEMIELYSLNPWIRNGQYDEDKIIREIKNKFNMEEISDRNKVLHEAVFDLDYKTTENGLKLALNDAYSGNLEPAEYVGLIDRLLYYKQYGIKFDFVDYNEISYGIDKLIQSYKHSKKENYLTLHVPSELFKRSDETTKISLEKLQYIEDNFLVWIARNRALDALRMHETNLYSLDVNWLEEFDEELLTTFGADFFDADNAGKRKLSHWLQGVDFIYDTGFSNKENQIEKQKKMMALSTSICNLGKLNDKISTKSEGEPDFITKIILNEFSSAILEKIQQINGALDSIKSSDNKSN